MQRIMITALVLLLMGILVGTANAQSPRNCGERTAIVERLADGYGETRQSIGIGARNSIMEVYANLDTGSWTVTVTLVNGMMCLVASGQYFEHLEPLPEGEPL